jgi:hypothetical protein
LIESSDERVMALLDSGQAPIDDWGAHGDAGGPRFHQAPPKKKYKTGAERAKAYRRRKRQEANPIAAPGAKPESSESVIPRELLSADSGIVERPVTPRHDEPVRQPAVTTHPTVTPSRRNLAPVLLTTAALVLGAVGVTINGWFARSLGASDLANGSS